MALLKWTSTAANRAQDMTEDTARQMRTRSRYLAHMAAAQGYRAAAKADDLRSQSSKYVRQHPAVTMGVVAGVIGLLSFLLYRRSRY